MTRFILTFFLCFTVLSSLGSTCLAAKTKIYTVKKGDTPFGVAKRFSISVDELLRFNSMSSTKSFKIGTKLDIPQKGQVTGSKYKVKSGDSVAKVADFHGVSQDDLRRINSMGSGAKLRAGQQIHIPKTLRGGAKGHVVRQGDTVAGIARKHGIKTRQLMAANKLGKNSRLKLGRTLVIPDKKNDAGTYKPKNTNKLVKSGEKIPGGVLHTVQSGQTLWIIARAYNVKGERIVQRNELDVQKGLVVGQKIKIPGAKEVVPVRVKGFSIQPINFVRVWNSKKLTAKLMKRNGRVSPFTRKKLSQLAGPRKKGSRAKLFHPRLIHMLQRVAERYPGKTFEVVSGYRPGETGSESQHSVGRAIDFRVSGIPNRELYNFCAQLPDSGCGYYPNSVFIHMDARDKSATWTDYSAPGEKAKYKKP